MKYKEATYTIEKHSSSDAHLEFLLDLFKKRPKSALYISRSIHGHMDLNREIGKKNTEDAFKDLEKILIEEGYPRPGDEQLKALLKRTHR